MRFPQFLDRLNPNIKMAEKYIDCDNFLVTYGDRLTTLDMAKLVENHHKSEKIGTTVAVRSPVRFRNYSRRHGALTESIEKSGLREVFISGGIFVYNRKIFDFLLGLSNFSLEQHLTEKLIKNNELSLYVYDGFWQLVDSDREVAQLRNNLHVLKYRN